MKTITRTRRLVRRRMLTWLVVLLLPFTAAAQKKTNAPKPVAGYGAATYKTAAAGTYMRHWLLAGPLLLKDETAADPDMAVQEKYFQEESLVQVVVTPGKSMEPSPIRGKAFAWKAHASPADAIDLDAFYNKPDLCQAFALAEIVSDEARPAVLAFGSDDGIKVYLNGKLVHKNWVPRGLKPDDDTVPVTLQKGSNQLLVVVQDINQGWGFTARLLDKAGLSEKLVDAAGRGNLDEAAMLLKAGALASHKNKQGLTALVAARLAGREEMVALLLKQGGKEEPVPAPAVLIDGLYSSLQGKMAPGIAILVSKDGKVLYKKGFGYADIGQKVPVSTTTKFRIGSITKQFTAASILRLQEQGKLQVTDKLSEYFPDFPRAGEVSIHQLLTHTSGIHSYTGKDDFLKRVVTPITNDDLLAYFKDDPYDFNPGDDYRYNNSAYFLLGYIVEKISGKPYGQYLKESFFDPLGMANTGVHASALKLANEAKGYTKNGTAFEPTLNWDMSWAAGAGALYSTVEDLYLWNEAVFGGKVLQEQSLNAAFTPVTLNNGTAPPGGRYGYGWALENYRGQEEIQHGGGLHGFLSMLARYPEENLTVTMLTNVTPQEVSIDPNRIAEFFLWEKMDKQTSYAVQEAPVKNLDAYAGRYDFANGAVMTVTTDGTALYAQLTGQQRFPIFPSGPDEFFWKVVDAKIKFVRDDKGHVTHGHFKQGTFEIDAKRLKEETIIAVDPAVYNEYAGMYNYGENIFIVVSTNAGKIYVQATNQPKFEIFPVADKEFILKDLNARLLFVREADGKVSKFILDMAGQKKEVARVE